MISPEMDRKQGAETIQRLLSKLFERIAQEIIDGTEMYISFGYTGLDELRPFELVASGEKIIIEVNYPKPRTL